MNKNTGLKIPLFNTSHFCIVLLLLLSACSNKWTLETSDTKVVVGIDNNSSPCIYELSNSNYKWNWTSTPSVLQLPTKVVVRGGGSFELVSWVFQGAKVDKSNGKTITLTFRCTQLPDISIQSIWWSASTIAPGPIQHTWKIYNEINSVVSLFPQMEGLDINVQSDQPMELWSFNKDGGGAVDPIGVHKTKIDNGTEYTISLFDGSASYGFIPVAILNSSEKHGLYCGWECQTGRIKVTTKNNLTNIKAGYANGGDVPEGYVDVASSSTFDIPSTYIGIYSGNVDDASNSLKHWFWTNKVPSNMRNDTTEPWTQFGGMFMYNANDPKVFWGADESTYRRGMQEKLSDVGFEAVEIDYGWWGPPSAPRSFEADKTWWPSSMSVGGRLAHQNAFKFNLYFCTLVNWDTKETLKTKWMEYGLDCWRNDFQRADLPTLDWLANNIPNYRYENCSGGAQWKDYATMRRASVQTVTDAVYPLQLRQAFYDASYAFPPAQLSQCNHWVAMKDSTFVYELRSGMQGAMFPAICAIGPKYNPANIVLPSDRPSWIPYMKSNVSLYKTKLRPLIREANLYHILPRPDGVHWDGIEYYNPNNQTGAVMLFKPDRLPDTKTILFDGLDTKKEYVLTFTDGPEQNTTLSGSELMGKGLTVNIKGKKQSEIIFFQAQ